ncbi:hypothetical protein HDU97_007821 [Phlyctochytrium planicorne]|nr:hypothetical protein HDU97_007821 [Phlyctochytrium planicorne]
MIFTIKSGSVINILISTILLLSQHSNAQFQQPGQVNVHMNGKISITANAAQISSIISSEIRNRCFADASTVSTANTQIKDPSGVTAISSFTSQNKSCQGKIQILASDRSAYVAQVFVTYSSEGAQRMGGDAVGPLFNSFGGSLPMNTGLDVVSTAGAPGIAKLQLQFQGAIQDASTCPGGRGQRAFQSAPYNYAISC